jgi:hypothetical protein
MVAVFLVIWVDLAKQVNVSGVGVFPLQTTSLWKQVPQRLLWLFDDHVCH